MSETLKIPTHTHTELWGTEPGPNDHTPQVVVQLGQEAHQSSQNFQFQAAIDLGNA